MKNLPISIRIYIGLIILNAVLAAVYVFLPQMAAPSVGGFPASRPVMAIANAAIMLILYGGLGFLGYNLSRRIGFADIWDCKVMNYQRFLIPMFIGIGTGIFFIIGDLIFSRFNTVGSLPHPPFPTSLVAALTAGIGEELIFRLLFISFWVWLISFKILKGKGQNTVFYIVSFFSALAFAVGHIPSVMFLFGWKSFAEIPMALMGEIILFNGVLSIFAAYYFRKFGFLAAVGIHFWTDIIWHLIWGLV